jgi:putative restriction endonuclease
VPRIPKRELLRRFELAIQDAGARLIYRSPPGQHPAPYTIVHRHGRTSRVLLYIWNMTHGGGAARPAHEYRIQITGVSIFENTPGEKTLILGWSEDFEVFSGFDYRRHAGALGASPSLQISQDALRAAQMRGFAPNAKDNGETAIAFRPDFAATYVEHLVALHATGAVPKGAAILERISEDPEAVTDTDIDAAVVPARRVEIIETRRAARDARFRRKVLTAYGNRCAVCGVQLRLLDAAHVLPVEHAGSTDDTNNGVALCALHHRAYDRALIAFDPTYTIHVNAKQVAEMTTLSVAGGLSSFRAAMKPSLLLPPDSRDHPRKDFIVAANKARGWKA